MKPIKKRLTLGAVALLAAFVIVAIAIVAVTRHSSTSYETTSEGAPAEEVPAEEAPVEEGSAPTQASKVDPEQPYARLKDDQVKSINYNLDDYDPLELGGSFKEDFLSLVKRLRVYAEPYEEFDASDFDGDYAFREDQLVVTLVDGSSFTLAPYGKTSDGNAVVYIDGVPFRAKMKDPVYELESLCERCANYLRTGGSSVISYGDGNFVFEVREITGREIETGHFVFSAETTEIISQDDNVTTMTVTTVSAP